MKGKKRMAFSRRTSIFLVLLFYIILNNSCTFKGQNGKNTSIHACDWFRQEEAKCGAVNHIYIPRGICYLVLGSCFLFLYSNSLVLVTSTIKSSNKY